MWNVHVIGLHQLQHLVVFSHAINRAVLSTGSVRDAPSGSWAMVAFSSGPGRVVQVQSCHGSVNLFHRSGHGRCVRKWPEALGPALYDLPEGVGQPAGLLRIRHLKRPTRLKLLRCRNVVFRNRPDASPGVVADTYLVKRH